MKIYLDGQFCAKEDAKISVFDHGSLYGDGIFRGHPLLSLVASFVWKNISGASTIRPGAICLKVPPQPRGDDRGGIETIRQNDLHDGYVRLVVTRGPGDLGAESRLCPARPRSSLSLPRSRCIPRKCIATA